MKRKGVSLVMAVSLVAVLGAWTGGAREAWAQPPSTCQVQAAPLTAYPSSYQGLCPAAITFKGTILVRGRVSPNNPCVVKYVFDRSDGVADTIEKTLKFTEAGAKAVTTTWTLGGAALQHYVGWEAIHIRRPTPGKQWGHANFELTCRVPSVQIASVECAAGRAVNVHILINSTVPISSYAVWPTWAMSPEFKQTLAVPGPVNINQVVSLAEGHPDPYDRNHQWGLRVDVPGMAGPILKYEMEPLGPDGRYRCPGHH
jgi:hypothetical protein